MQKDDHVGKFSSEYDKLWANFIENNERKSFSKETLMEKAIEFEKQATETRSSKSGDFEE